MKHIHDYDDERLAMLEMMIENGQVFDGYQKKKEEKVVHAPKTDRVYSVERKKKVSDDQIKEAIKDYASWDEIGESLGISGSSAKKRAKALGLKKKSYSSGIISTVSDDQIKQAVDDTKTWAEIGASLGISGNNARVRATALGIKKKKVHKLYDISNEEFLEAIDPTKTWSEIAKALGMVESTVRSKAFYLGCEKKPLTKLRRVSNEQILALRKQNMTWVEIGKLVGLSCMSLRNRMRKIGHPWTRVYVHVSDDQIREVFAQYAETKTWDEMAEILGLSQPNLIRRARRLGLQRKKLHRSRSKP